MPNVHGKDKSALEELFSSGLRMEYQKGEVIIRPDETPQGVFFIFSGYVKSYDITKYGEQNLLVMRKSGQVFPLIWTMTDERTGVFYEAVTDTMLFRISREVYSKAVDEDPEFVRAVLDQVLRMYQIHSQRILNLEFRSASERIAYRLITLANNFGKRLPNGHIEIEVPITRHDIASSVNCSRETASRELAKLEKKEYIQSTNGHIVVLRPEEILAKVEHEGAFPNVFNQ